MVTFTVIDQNGSPIMGAEVTMTSHCSPYGGQTVTGYTNADGQVQLATGCAYNGTFTYQVSAPGYNTVNGNGSLICNPYIGGGCHASVTVYLTSLQSGGLTSPQGAVCPLFPLGISTSPIYRFRVQLCAALKTRVGGRKRLL